MFKNSANIRYLRISVTDRCNLRCRYCMPKGYAVRTPPCDVLNDDEMARIVHASTLAGIDAIRITGGEPLMRNDITHIIKKISLHPAVKHVSITTNGSIIAAIAEDLKNAGVDSVNISMDTLLGDRYREISGEDFLPDVLKGIEAAKNTFDLVKLNVVVMRHINDDEIINFCRFAQGNDLLIRFIEFMPHLNCATDFLYPKREILNVIRKYFGTVEQTSDTFGLGPAKYYRVAHLKNPIGIIASVTAPSCDTCNRLRITADGRLLPCLYSAKHYDLKDALRQNGDLLSIFSAAINDKCSTFQPLTCRLRQNMVELGG